MRNHSFYNVGHGDAILIQDDTSLVVRDVGQPSKIKQIKKFFYQNSLNQALLDITQSNLKRFAIVSHAHEDHFSGFMQLYFQNKFHIFEEAFIPPLVCGPTYILHPIGCSSEFSLRDFLKEKVDFYLKVYAALKKGITKKNLSNWFFLLPVMNYLSKKVSQVSFSDKILNGSATVLWPYLPKSAKDGNDCDAYDVFPCKDDFEHFNKVNLEYALWNGDVGNQDQFQQYTDEIVDVYLKILDARQDERESISDRQQYEKEDLVRKIESVLKKVDGVQLKMSYPQKLLFCWAINHDDDNQSLVFQYDDASAIYLSDLYGTYISRMINVMNASGLLKPLYELLKSSHHGSRYDVSLQNTNYNDVVHCCGVGKKNQYGPNAGYLARLQRSICLDWDSQSPKWNPNVLNASLLVYPSDRIVIRV